jgi:ribosome-associated protein
VAGDLVDGDDDLRTPGGLVVRGNDLVWSFARSGGPGGQHVNVTASKATLTVATDTIAGGTAAARRRIIESLGAEVRFTSSSHRSQWRNRQDCLERLAVALDEAARPPAPPRRPTRPGRGAVERRLDSKRRDSEKKQGRRATEW